MHTRRSLFARILPTLLAALLITCGVYAADELEPSFNLAGTWKCRGVDPTRAAYQGTVTMAREGDTYRVKWSIDGTIYTGVGVIVSDVLAVSYYGKMSGIIAYQIKGNTLTGKWSIADSKGAMGVETLTR